jgi:hypothetical protein
MSAQTRTPFGYASGDPLNRVDPSGNADDQQVDCYAQGQLETTISVPAGENLSDACVQVLDQGYFDVSADQIVGVPHGSPGPDSWYGPAPGTTPNPTYTPPPVNNSWNETSTGQAGGDSSYWGNQYDNGQSGNGASLCFILESGCQTVLTPEDSLECLHAIFDWLWETAQEGAQDLASDPP